MHMTGELEPLLQHKRCGKQQGVAAGAEATRC